MEKNEAVIVKTAGALLGIQRSENGRNQVEICTSFELKLVNQDAAIDAAFLTHQLEQCKTNEAAMIAIDCSIFGS